MGCFATFPSGFAGLFRRKLMGSAFRMSRFSAFTRDFPLFLLIHGSETSLAGIATTAF
jgi:hypothetical protein